MDGKTRTVEFQKHMGIRADIGGDRGWSEVIRGDQGRSGEIRGDRRRSEESRAAGCRGRTAPVRVAVVLRPKVAPRGLGVGRARGQGPLRAAALVRPTSSRGTQHAIVWHALSSLAGSALAAHAPVRGARGAVARGQRVERQRSGLKVTDHHRCGGAWVVARGRRGRRATNLQNKG